MSFVTGDPSQSFFEQNPTLKFKSEFKSLLKNVSEEEASNICWAVFMIEDVDIEVNKLARMSKEDRIKEVQENYYNIDVDKYKPLLDAYARMAMSVEERMYKLQVEKMQEVTDHLSSLKIVNKNDFEKIIKLLSTLPKMWDGLDKVKSKMIDSQNKKVRGGSKLSARERRR